MTWYTLQTNPNYENKVIEQIDAKKKELNLSQIREIFSPEEVVVDYKNGKKIEKKKKLYSNYLFIEMDYSDNLLYILKKIKGVVGFVGNRNSPVEVSEKEIDIMKNRISSNVPKLKISFDIGTNVRIISGSFADFQGIVHSVDYEKQKAKVTVTIFNRETVVDLEINTLELVK